MDSSLCVLKRGFYSLANLGIAFEVALKVVSAILLNK
jgi:hypothetical protein